MRIKLSSTSGCYVSVRRERILFLFFLRLAHLCVISSNLIKFKQVLVSRKHTNVCRTVVEIPYDIGGLYVGLDVRATSVGAEVSSRGLRLSATFLLGLALGD